MTIHLRSITLTAQALKTAAAPDNRFPFNLPIIQHWQPLEFTSPITFLVGENGSGKSTLLEALACAAGSITVGSENIQTDPSLAHARSLAAAMKLTWRLRTRKGFFLRAEDFFGYVRQVNRVQSELHDDLKHVDEEYQGRSDLARSMAKMPYARELSALRDSYGAGGLDGRSHGESYLAFFQARFVPGGLYLLDEPEAALSPLRQLSFLALLADMTGQDAQFIIATHSPILMAFPGAVIWSFDEPPIHPAAYDSLEHVRLTREFLASPERFLRYLK